MVFLVKINEGHLVTDVRQYAIMRPRMDTECPELQEIVECMNRKQKVLLTTVEQM